MKVSNQGCTLPVLKTVISGCYLQNRIQEITKKKEASYNFQNEKCNFVRSRV